MENTCNLGCPKDFAFIIKSFHDGMHAWLSVGGNMAGHIPIDYRAKHEDVLSTTPFSLYFAATLTHPCVVNSSLWIYAKYRSSGRLFKYRSFGSFLTCVDLPPIRKSSSFLFVTVFMKMTVT